MSAKHLLPFLLLLLSIQVCSQDKFLLSENKTFPDSSILVLEGKNKQPFTIPGLKGKKMIIDFFSSTCVVCFRMIPKIDTFQAKYKNDIRFILIGNEDRNIRSIYKKFSERFNLNLDVVYDSSIFSRLRINVVPQYVWIDEHGIVVAITGVEEMTEDNIKQFALKGAIVRQSQEVNYDFDPQKLLFVNENGGINTNIIYRSLLSEWRQGQSIYIPPTIKMAAETDKFQAVGVTLNDLYRYAYFGVSNWDIYHENYGKIFPNLLIADTDSNQLFSAGSEKRFCYSLFKSNTILHAETIQAYLKKELAFYSGYKARVVKRMVPCWRLVVSDKKKIPVSKGSKPNIKKDITGFTLTNHPVSKILEMVYRYNPQEIPFVDCTGISHTLDLNINALMTDITDISTNLKKFGLAIEKGETFMEAVVLERPN